MTERVSAATWAGFALMCVGMFMAILDIQIVATSLPAIQAAIGIGQDQISWVQTAYLIAEVIAIPLTGFLTRLLSMRWLFVTSVSLFTLASLGCAASQSFGALIAWRVVQGFAGGTLIPAVFAAVFLLFPARRQALATTIGGVLAVLAPTLGPVAGGFITDTWSWHWLFLVNVAPGVIAATGAASLLPRQAANLDEARRLDLPALALMAVALAALEIALKEAPPENWHAPTVLGLFALFLASIAFFVRRTLGALHPVVDLQRLGDRRFAAGCVLSFVLGIGLFGSTYLMPVFLGFVREHSALEIGEIMLVTGIAQLVTAPVAVSMERRLDPRWLTALGFLVFAAGHALSAFHTVETDFGQMIAPQILRGAAIMFCLLPPTRLALGHVAPAHVADASGLFNLMRNLGGAIGIALIDTVIYGRAPAHARVIVERLQAGDVETAKAVGIPLTQFIERVPGPVAPDVQAMLEPLVERLALVRSINEAWATVAILTLLALLALPFASSRRTT